MINFTDPKFYDKKIQEINTSLASLGWIETIYPLAMMGEDEQGTFPEVYHNDGTRNSIRVFPHGNSISFFTINSPIQQLDESEMYGVELNFLVWADMTKVYPNKAYNYTTELINDVRKILEDHSGYGFSILLNNVFDGFSQLEKIENQNVMLPYTAFKITFTVDLLTC